MIYYTQYYNNVKPHPCGYLGNADKECVCSSSQITRYQKRISGPILDRIDLHIEVPAVRADKLTDGENNSESSKEIKKRVQKARDLQTRRFKGKDITCNAEMHVRMIKELCPLDTNSLSLLSQAVSRLGLSARGYNRIIKVARTIADLAGETKISNTHIAEALQYRPKTET